MATDGNFTGFWKCGGRWLKPKHSLDARVKQSNGRLTSSDAPERLCAAGQSASKLEIHFVGVPISSQQSISHITLQNFHCAKTNCQRIVRHITKIKVIQNLKKLNKIRKKKQNTRELSDPKCETENCSPAKPSGRSWAGQIYIIKRINTGHYPSTSQPQLHGPNAQKYFMLSSPFS